MTKSLKIFLFLLFLSKFSFAQKKIAFEFNQITEQDGLAQNYVNGFLYDKDGYLWVATEDGLNRFDGSHFDVFKSNYKKPNRLLENTTISLCEDKQGNIWVATAKGISCFIKQKGEFINFKSFKNKDFTPCFNLLCDTRGYVWFSTDSGLYCINPVDFSFVDAEKQPFMKEAIEINNKNCLVEDTVNNGLWVGTDVGLFFLDFKTNQTFSVKNNPQKTPILDNSFVSSLAINNGKLYYADNTKHKIIVFDLAQLKIIKAYLFPAKIVAKRNYAIATFVDKKQNIWLSFLENSYLIDAKTDEISEIESKQVSEMITTKSLRFQNVWQSDDGTIWLGANGILTVNPDKIPYKSYDIGKLSFITNKNELITTFAEDADKTMWLGTLKRKLIHYFPEKNTVDTFNLPPTPINYHKFIHTVVDAREKVYVAAYDGVFVLHKNSKKITKFPLPNSIDWTKIWLMSFALKDDFIWIRTNVAIVLSYQFSTKKWHEYTLNSVEKGNLNTTRMFLVFDKKGDLWANLYPNGLAKFSETEQKFINENIKNPNGFEFWFNQFKADEENNLWFPTIGYGLVKYDTKKKIYENWRESDGLVSDQCFAVAIDKSSNIWVGSHDKFSLMDKKRHIVNFALPFNFGVNTYRYYLYRLKSGNILAIQKNILVEFQTEKKDSPRFYGNLLISSIQLHDSTIFLNSVVKKVDLGINQNNFDIKFASFNYNQNAYNYFYQLKGIDKNWVDAGTNTVAHYTNLQGGDYTFLVKVVTGDVVSKTQSIRIHIATVFYKTWWFLTLILLLLAYLAYEFYRYRLSQTAKVLHLQMLTTRLEKSNTEIQYQNLINHLNPHFLFNSLTSLNSLISINPKQASQFLKRLSLIYRYILQNKDKEMVSLEEEISFVQHYIELQKSRFEEGLQISIKIEKGYEKLKIVPVTLQNLLENAIKHNIIDDENPLKISVFTQDNYLIVENILQKKHYVETSNKQGLASLQSLYHYLTNRELVATEINRKFVVKVPLL